MATLPLIFDIRHFSQDDGPGIRTTVFFKGCPLSCAWCHNPESQNQAPEISFLNEHCINCGECRKVCPRGAIRHDTLERIERLFCNSCGLCAEQCPSTALRIVGKAMSEEDLLSTLLRDRLFFMTSGGGVTFSGGEPTMHADFLAEILPRLWQHSISITLQTCGHFDADSFRRLLLPHLDLIHFDLKLADSEQHRRYTGLDNDLILNNFRWLATEAKGRLLPRLPLIQSITANKENLAAIATLVREAGLAHCQLLPYHPGGLAKHQCLGHQAAAWLPTTMLTVEEERHWHEVMRRCLAEDRGRPDVETTVGANR